MRNVSRLLVVLFVLAFASYTFAAQAGAPKAAPQEKAFQGTLVKVDADAKTLTAKGEDNKDMVFHYTDKTEVVGAEKTVQGLAAKSGTKVNIEYASQGANNIAMRIEVAGK